MPRTPSEQANRPLLQIYATTVWAVGTVLCAVSSAYAFTPGVLPGENCDAPGRPDCGSFTQILSSGLYEENHQNITKAALSTVHFTPPSSSNPVAFSNPAVKDIIDANARVDYNQGAGTEELHFDNASLARSSDWLRTGRNQLLQALKLPSTWSAQEVDEMREVLGEHLHTLQDFYSHSNYVSLTAPHADAVAFVTAPGPGIAVLADQPDGINPCFHFNRETVLRTEAKESLLTTGYALGNLQLADAPPGQCAHGFILNGIHKDWRTRNDFEKAYRNAKDASIQYVNSIINDSQNNPNNVCMLMTGKPCQNECSADPSPTISGSIKVLSRVNGNLRGNFGEEFSGATISKGFSEGGASAAVTGQKGSLSLTTQGRSGGEIASSLAELKVSYTESVLISAPGTTGLGSVTFTPSVGKGAVATCSDEQTVSTAAYDLAIQGSFTQGKQDLCPVPTSFEEINIPSIQFNFSYGVPFRIPLTLDASASSQISAGSGGSANANINLTYSAGNFAVQSPPPGVTVQFCRASP